MKLNKVFHPSWQTNKYNIDSELYERLCDKSKQIFGSKYRWRKIAESTGDSLLTIEQEFDKLLSFVTKKLEEKRERAEAIRNNVTSNDESGSPETKRDEV